MGLLTFQNTDAQPVPVLGGITEIARPYADNRMVGEDESGGTWPPPACGWCCPAAVVVSAGEIRH